MSDNETSAPNEIHLRADNAAVIKHMEMYQGIITRMANNSAACKNWGIPLVAIILGFVVESKNLDLALLAVLTTFILYFLDSYYLMLENRFREGFNASAKKVRKGIFSSSELFRLLPMGSEKALWLKAVTSFATWPVYFGLLIVVVFGYAVVK